MNSTTPAPAANSLLPALKAGFSWDGYLVPRGLAYVEPGPLVEDDARRLVPDGLIGG